MTENIHKHRILILDFVSQYTQLVARRVRELGVYCELWAWDVTEAQIRDFNPSGIILSGGPDSVHEPDSPPLTTRIFELELPLLGLSYGLPLIMMLLVGVVHRSDTGQYGPASFQLHHFGDHFLFNTSP
ncbi:hypothetical protein IQB76_17925, partial [Leptospira borgpetersenii serovar Hardjo-bovis]|uniref:glutamine amidotransferase-related protein n=1 Tax=Leptospira borgpetersenii TaxID=174 RepID=UPI0019D84412|nr:hypothetical protein [Leptospira borgpetersenii serovar Hardjo-bovis]